MKVKTRKDACRRRHLRLRQKVQGTAGRPRMCVHVTGSHLYVQFIDDTDQRTLAAASTLDKEMKAKVRGRNNATAARELGRFAAELARKKGIAAVVFDRGGFRYGGRIKGLADAAREAGLKF